MGVLRLSTTSTTLPPLSTSSRHTWKVASTTLKSDLLTFQAGRTPLRPSRFRLRWWSKGPVGWARELFRTTIDSDLLPWMDILLLLSSDSLYTYEKEYILVIYSYQSKLKSSHSATLRSFGTFISCASCPDCCISFKCIFFGNLKGDPFTERPLRLRDLKSGISGLPA